MNKFNHRIYEYAFYWSMLGPFAFNWAVPIYHAFKAIDSHDEMTLEALWFPLGWVAYTIGQMIFQIYFYSSVISYFYDPVRPDPTLDPDYVPEFPDEDPGMP
jgi:hypothetical protein